MLSKSGKHNTKVDFAALLQHDDQHAIATQEHAEPVKSSYASAKRLKKKHNTSHAVDPPRMQDGSPCIQMVASPPVLHTSLWDSYKELYSIQFGNGDYFPVAQRTKLQSDEHSICIVKRFPGVNVEERIHAFQRINHQQFVQVQKLFSVQNDLLVAFEFMPVSLAEVEGNPLLDDLQLASILGQVCCAFSWQSSPLLREIDCECFVVPGKEFARSWPAYTLQYSDRCTRKCEALYVEV